MSNVSTFLIKNFELKQKEVTIFMLLFFHSFFLGWFIAFYFVAANSIFINHYGSEQLPYAYIIAGLMGYFSTAFYSWIQKKINSKWLFSGALIFMLLISILGRFGHPLIDEKYLSIFVFIWAWPFISLSGIEAGGLSLRFLNLVQVKRLFGLFNMGGVFAAILSYFAIPLLKPIIGHLYNLLYVGLVGLVISIVILFIMYAKSEKNENNHKKTIKEKRQAKKKNDTRFLILLKDKYFVWIFASATISMAMIYVIDFGFLSSMKTQIAPENVAQFLGLVYGALKVGELIISYSSRRLLSRYGVKLGLTALPIVAAILIFGATVTGLVIGAANMIFLILMVFTKSMERILRRGLDDPAFNVLYQPIAKEKQMAVQTKVGVVMQFSIAIAGLLLFLANKILIINGVFHLEYFPLLFLPILVLWIYVSLKLYKAYKTKIKEILTDLSKDKRRGTDRYQYGGEILRKNLKNENKEILNFSIILLSETNPKLLEAYASNLLEVTDDSKYQKAILRNIDPTWRKRLSKSIEKMEARELPPDLEKMAKHAKENLDYSDIKKITEEEAQNLLKSNKTSDKLRLIKYINKRKYEANDEVIMTLLDDSDKIVKMSAINLSVRIKSDKLISKLVSFIKIPEYQHIVANVLLDFGSSALPMLDEYFNNQADTDILIKITEIYAKIGTKQAKSLLLKRINYPDRKVQLSVIWALYFCKYQAGGSDIDLIKLKLNDSVENILWIFATIETIETQKNTLKLFLALDVEKELNLEVIFLLLSFLYEPRIITLIQKNIIGKDTIFALEIIDNFFTQDIKKLITPLFDDISSHQKIKRLSYKFPQEKMSFTERLRAIVVRDYDKLDTWTITKAIELLGKLHKKSISKTSKASAIRDYNDIKIWNKSKINETLEKIRRSEMPDEIFVALYHTDEMIYSTAAKIIHTENPIKCFDYLANMSEKKQQLMNILSNNGRLLTDNVKIIKRHPLLFSVPENLIVDFARLTKVKELKKDDKIQLSYKNSDDILFIMKGTLIFNEGYEDEQYYFKNDLVIRGLNIDDFANILVAKEDAQIIIINRYSFFDILISEREIIRNILDTINVSKWNF